MDDSCVHEFDSDDICLLHTQGHAPPAPQLNISAFAHMQSNGVIDGTKDWETVEAEDPLAKDHLNSNAPGAGAPGF